MLPKQKSLKIQDEEVDEKEKDPELERACDRCRDRRKWSSGSISLMA